MPGGAGEADLHKGCVEEEESQEGGEGFDARWDCFVNE